LLLLIPSVSVTGSPNSIVFFLDHLYLVLHVPVLLVIIATGTFLIERVSQHQQQVSTNLFSKSVFLKLTS